MNVYVIKIEDIPRVADVLGALLFLILSVYFLAKPDKTTYETALMVCTMLAFAIDVLFVLAFFSK